MTTTYESDEAGTILMELNTGDYVIEQTGLEDYYLYSSFSVEDEDLSFNLDYAIASTLSVRFWPTRLIMMKIGRNRY